MNSMDWTAAFSLVRRATYLTVRLSTQEMALGRELVRLGMLTATELMRGFHALSCHGSVLF